MTLEEYFNKERRVGKGYYGKLLLFEALTLKKIQDNKNISIVKNRHMHMTNIAMNYICWYAINNPNSFNIYATYNSLPMIDIADYLNDMGVLEKWEQMGKNGPREITLFNGSIILCYIQTTLEVNVTFRGKNYDIMVFDEMDIDINDALNMNNYYKLIIIDSPNDFIYKYWKFDEENYNMLHKIALSIDQNQYRMIDAFKGPNRYYIDMESINPFKVMEIEINKKNK